MASVKQLKSEQIRYFKEFSDCAGSRCNLADLAPLRLLNNRLQMALEILYSDVLEIPKLVEDIMDASDLRVFEAVARVGSITKAAEALHTVQSNVTTRIRLLEDELGVTLFQRHPRGVTPTIAGQRLFPYAMRIAKLLAEAKDMVDEKAEPQGTLLFGTLETTAAMRLPPVLATYKKKFPKVGISLRTGTACSLIEDVMAHRLEGAFVPGPVNHPELVEEVMFSEELVIVTGKFGPTLEMLAERGEAEILVFRVGCSYRQRLETILVTRGIGHIRHLELGTLEGIIGLISAGIGISLLPKVVVAAAQREGRVATYELPAKQSHVDTVFIRRRDAFYSNALLKLVEIAKLTHGPIKKATPLAVSVRPLKVAAI
jgi:DNA-binding transcriptional LysR family regulator